jgi:hypothetical protein
MNNEGISRLGGWALMLGSIAFNIGIYASSIYPDNPMGQTLGLFIGMPLLVVEYWDCGADTVMDQVVLEKTYR